MNRHLSSRRIVESMVTGQPAEEERHARECAECAAQVERLRQSLGLFRGSVREMAARLEPEIVERQTVLKASNRLAGWRWAMAAAAVVVMLIGLPVFRAQWAAQRLAQVTRQDAELMEQVNAELSSDVAAPMKPLEKMVGWGTGVEKKTEIGKF